MKKVKSKIEPDGHRASRDNKDNKEYCPTCGWLLAVDGNGKKYCISRSCYNG